MSLTTLFNLPVMLTSIKPADKESRNHIEDLNHFRLLNLGVLNSLNTFFQHGLGLCASEHPSTAGPSRNTYTLNP